jgi:uncharacterized protein YneF (UPF0154 family)
MILLIAGLIVGCLAGYWIRGQVTVNIKKNNPKQKPLDNEIKK